MADYDALRAALDADPFPGLSDADAAASAGPPAPAPFTVAQVFGLLAPASAAKLLTVAFLPDVRDKIQANDRPGCALYLNLFLAGGVISQPEHDAIMGILADTVPGPPALEVAFGQPVTADDVHAARLGS